MIKLDRDFLARMLDDLLKQLTKRTINKIGRQQQFVRRRRKITAFDFLILLVLDSGSSLLETQAANLPAHVSASGLYYRFTASAVNFLQACLSLVLKRAIESFGKLEVSALNFCDRLLLADSTTVAVDRSLADVLPGSGGDGPAASYKLQVVLDIKAGKLESCEITKGREPDQKYANKLPGFVRPGDLIIADLGYFNIGALQAISQMEAYFLSRLRFGSRLSNPADRTVLTTTDLFKDQLTDRYVLVGQGDHPLLCRLICFPVPEQVANKRRQKLRENSRRRTGKQPSQERLQYCDWTLLITNLPPTCLSVDLAWAVYRLRWQIELFFKVLKSVFALEKIRTSNYHRLRCHVLGKLILSALIFRISGVINIKCWNDFHRELSFHKLAKRLAHSSTKIAVSFGISCKQAVRHLTETILRCVDHCLKSPSTTRKTTLQLLLSPSQPRYELIA